MSNHTPSRNKPTIEERFWSKVDRRSPTECWEWQAGRHDKMGYGAFLIGRRSCLSHRVAYQLTNGDIPKGLYVLHSCDNPPCCNPAHLFLGTYQDNNRDKARKGRANPPFGEREPNHKLTEADVRQIRQRYAAGNVRQRDIAADYGISQRLVSLIVRREAWRHIE